ncbi:MAG: DUF2459 domain-containing protein [Flavobacteriales bacterium]|uniref:DUF2459 domain-containing protein n=1 Tax=Candidatus Ulvibacter alkanivorans TaxID=2267620 RepID=UPI000DF3DA48|nr:DUF2459 domain-containing protein [Candidatus Ulvibacter alkanivorans]MCH2490885.1 DUF2459 domain-containing protein [Flavobacteriales bacterium]
MKLVKNVMKWICYILSIPVAYVLISLLLSAITIDRELEKKNYEKTIYLHTNGVHLNIIVPIAQMDTLLLSNLKHKENDVYLGFGWGDENFYINTPTWSDLTINNAFKAMFLKSPTLLHITRYQEKRHNWVQIEVSESEFEQLSLYLLNTFQTNEQGEKIILEDMGYTATDDFYKAKGNYTCFNTCNSWVNTGFKESGLKACLWTPFDFGLLNKYE